jgi:hypothetical protein
VGPVSAGWVPPSQLVSACKALHFFGKEKNDCTLIIRCKNFVHRMRVDIGQLGKLIKALVCVSRHGRIYAWLYTVAEDEPKWLAGGTVLKLCVLRRSEVWRRPQLVIPDAPPLVI